MRKSLYYLYLLLTMAIDLVSPPARLARNYGFVHNREFINGVADAHKDALETGFAAGGGIEYAITPRISLKAEYQYIDLGSYKLSAPVIPPNGIVITTNTLENNFNTVRAGINFHLTPAPEPLK